MTIRVAGRGFAQPSIKPLYDVTLSGTGRFDVTGIPPGYSMIEILALLRSDVASTVDVLDIFLNGDTTAANYRRGRILAETATGVSYQGGDDSVSGRIAAASTTANYFATTQIIIPFYSSTTFNKNIDVITNFRELTTDVEVMTFNLQWENTAAVNQITLQPDGYAADEFIANSRLQIWLHR